jgi:hypothetical protein
MAIVVLSLATFAAFWGRNAWPTLPTHQPGDRDPYGFGHARLGLSRRFNPQPKGWLQQNLAGGGDDGGRVPTYPREPTTDDEDAGL